MFRFGDPGGRVYGAVGAANVNLIAYWGSIGASGTWSLTAGGGRTTGTCLHVNGISNTTYLSKLLDAQSTWGVALAIKYTTALPANTTVLLAFSDSGTTQVDLRITSAGALQFTRNGTNIGSASSSNLVAGVWYHVEGKVVIDPSVGTIECRVNGAAVIGPTGSLNTRNTTNSSANQFVLGSLSTTSASPTAVDFDDIIVWDTQTTDAQGNADIHDFIGDCGLAWLLPIAAGTSTQYTPDSGFNYARVQDTTIDTTSYVESSTLNQIDSYNIADLPASATSIKTAAVIAYTRKTDTGSRGIKNLVRTASTNYLQTNETALSDSYLYYFQNWGSNPNTTVAWTPSDINGLEVGQKVTT